MTFRDRLLATLRAIQPVLDQAGVMVIGSEVPNLLEQGAKTTLVVSQDVDVGIPVSAHKSVKQQLRQVRGLRASADEPSVWTADNNEELIEVNFVGIDPAIQEAEQSYALEDDELPLLVFGQLSWLRVGRTIEVEGVRVPVPRPAGLLLEKLVTDRSGEKGDRDLLVALGMILTAAPADIEEMETLYVALRPELRHAVRSNLTILSLLPPRSGMPDPLAHRDKVAALLRRLDAKEDVNS